LYIKATARYIKVIDEVCVMTWMLLRRRRLQSSCEFIKKKRQGVHEAGKKVAGVEVSIIFGAVNVSIGGLIAGQMACFDLEPCSQINPPSAFEVVFYLARERAPQRLFIMLIII
jgi:hypothetical protein